MNPEQEELRRKDKEIAKLKMERDILKKAATVMIMQLRNHFLVP